MKQRSSGVLLHPTSLANAYPIGDLGPAAYRFADFLYEGGQSEWQMLPVSPSGGGDSPYQSPSAFAGNPLLLSPDPWVERGWLDRQDIEMDSTPAPGKVDFHRAALLKNQWFKKAYGRFEQMAKGPDLARFEAFFQSESYWLEDFVLFTVLQSKQGTANWTRWPEELKNRQLSALRQTRKKFESEILFHKFIQWQFAEQWEGLKTYCAQKGIGLIGDIPMFVSYESADVWAHPEIFKLNPDGSLPLVAGVPPDYFSPDGQVWGTPLYRWDVLRDQGYRWWIERLKKAMERFDLNRLDHFIGFERAFEVPAGESTAKNGQYQPGGGAPFFEAVRKAFGRLPLIAEDLGLITPEVEALRDQFELPSTKVLQFDFDASLKTLSLAPDRHPVNSVVYTGTHDNDTTAGWYAQLSPEHKEALKKELDTDDPGVVWAMIGKAMAAKANLAIFPAQDLLELGSQDRMNIPGTAEGNWSWRLLDGALTPALADKLRNLTRAHGR